MHQAPNQPTLVIMAAGIGSRFGGLKQLASVGMGGEPIIHFSLFDAIEAGFGRVIFIIKKEIEEEFRERIGNPLEGKIQVSYAFQSLEDLPNGYQVPEGRAKPWGTSHAILCAKALIDGPFAIINADDYYGKDAFHVMADWLQNHQDDALYRCSMVGYQIENTLTDNGYVTRGVCQTKGGRLLTIEERLRIEKHGDRIEYTEDDGGSWNPIEPGTTVSMNLWGFSPGVLQELEDRFPRFLDQALRENPLKAEYLLPRVIGDLVEEKRATVEVLHSKDKWYGVTYQEDLEPVAMAIQSMQKQGFYPLQLHA